MGKPKHHTQVITHSRLQRIKSVPLKDCENSGFDECKLLNNREKTLLKLQSSYKVQKKIIKTSSYNSKSIEWQ